MVLEAKKFSIHFSDAEIDDLRRRLADTRLPDAELLPLLDGWDYGTNLLWLRAMVARWQRDFDFKKLQDDIGRFFTLEIHDTLSDD